MTQPIRRLALPVLGGLGMALVVVAAAAAAAGGSHQPVYSPLLAHEAGQRDAVASPSLPYTTAVYATSLGPTSLDPALAYDLQSWLVIGQIYEPLLTYQRDRADVHVPLLASGWTISPDGRTYTFTVRSGVLFQNGALLTAQDVAFSFWRGILYAGASGPATPQWVIEQALFNLNGYTTPFQVSCNDVKNAITFDNAAETVTFHLLQPYGSLLDILAAPFSSVLNQAWFVAHGGWNGDCATWQTYYGTWATSPIITDTNGTGPYALQNWITATGNVTLTRNDAYWRNVQLWPGAPTGPAALQTIDIQVVPTSSVRSAMLLSGQADLADIDQPDPAFTSSVLLRYPAPDGLQSSLGAVTGTLRSYAGLLAPNARDGIFGYNIASGPYIGSGALDGQGIPPNFFTDIHVRKAFNYAFNWDSFIQQAYGGQALQRKGPIIKGILGYNDTEPSYFYSPTLALQEFGQAWGGQVLSNGFVMTVPFSIGDPERQAFANVLKTGIEGLNPNFHIYIVGLSSSDYQAESLFGNSNSTMPISVNGWLEDIPHPDDWVQGYLAGFWSGQQQLPAADSNFYAAEVTACRALSDAAAQTCYENLQASTYYRATDIFLAQPTPTEYVRAEVRGYFANVAFWNGPQFYYLSKGPLPVVQTVNAAADQTISTTSANGAFTGIEIPPGTITDGVKIALTTNTGQYTSPVGLRLGLLTLSVDLYDAGGDLLPSQALGSPVTVTIHYNPATLGGLSENSLTLFRWDGSAYVDAACGAYVRDLTHHVLQVPICHLSQFAVAGTPSLFLPLVRR